jgi:predicted transcriptional regulator
MPKKPRNPLTVAEMEKMKALIANGKTYHAVAQELNRSPHTIKKYATESETTKEIQKIKQELADMYEGLARRMINSITDEDIQKINAYQRTLSAAVSTDKMRLLREQSTDIIDLKSVSLDINELINQCQEALKDPVPVHGGEIE